VLDGQVEELASREQRQNSSQRSSLYADGGGGDDTDTAFEQAIHQSLIQPQSSTLTADEEQMQMILRQAKR